MYEQLLDELRRTGISFKDGGWRTSPGTDYGVLLMDGGGATIWADDVIQEQAITGAVHLFTRDDGRAQMQSVQAALARAGVCWRLESIRYEEGTRLTHYEWSIELEAL
jgi:hypothetical protein